MLLSRLPDTFRSFYRKPSLREGSIVLIDQGFFSVATFLTGVLVARASSKEEYGVYVLGWSLILIVQGVQRALVNVPFTVYAPRLDARNRNIYQGSAFIHTLVLCVVCAMLGMTAILWISSASMDSRENGLNTSIRSILIVALCISLREFIRYALLARLDVWGSVLTNLAATVLQLTLLVSLYMIGQLTVQRAFESFALTSFVVAVFMIWTHRHQMCVVRERLWRDFTAGWRLGKWIVLELFTYMGASQVYPWLLLYYVDAKAVAVFGVGSAVAGLVTPLSRAAGSYIQPRMAHAYKDANNIDVLLRLARLSAICMSVPYGIWMIVGSLFGNHIVVLFYTRFYSGYQLLLVLLLIKYFIEAVSTPLSQALEVLERTDAVTKSLAIGMVVSLSLGPILILTMGIDGAGLASLLSTVATLACRRLLLKKIVYQLHSVPALV